MTVKTKIKEEVNTAKSTWYVWLFPVIAILVCIYLSIDYLKQRGPQIQISFEDASSIQPEKTRVRFRGVTIGVVHKVAIAADNKSVTAYVTLLRSAKNFAVEGSKFWVVLPKVGFQGVSGLETIFEGTYIAAQPGKPDAKPNNQFKGYVGSETNDIVEDTVAYYLETTNAESVSVGDLITYRGLSIGSVTRINLAKTSQTVIVQINIQNKFVKLVRTNSLFWKKSAVQANLGLFNSEIKVGSLDSLLHGGIELATPDKAEGIAKGQSKFALHNNSVKGYEKWSPILEFKE